MRGAVVRGRTKPYRPKGWPLSARMRQALRAAPLRLVGGRWYGRGHVFGSTLVLKLEDRRLLRRAVEDDPDGRLFVLTDGGAAVVEDDRRRGRNGRVKRDRGEMQDGCGQPFNAA